MVAFAGQAVEAGRVLPRRAAIAQVNRTRNPGAVRRRDVVAPTRVGSESGRFAHRVVLSGSRTDMTTHRDPRVPRAVLAAVYWIAAACPAALAQQVRPLYAYVDNQLSVVDSSLAAHTPLPGFGGRQAVAFTEDDRLFIAGGTSYLSAELYEMDPDTGKRIGRIVLFLGTVFFHADRMTVQPGTGMIYAVGMDFDYHGFRWWNLIKFDPDCAGFCYATEVLDGGNLQFMGGAAFTPDGTLYLIATQRSGAHELWTVDPTTGAQLSSVPLSTFLTTLVVRPSDGALLGAVSGRVHEIDPATGIATPIGPALGSFVNDFAYRPFDAGSGCPGAAPVFGQTLLKSASSTTWRCPFPAAAGSCALLVWPPVSSPVPLRSPPGCTGPRGGACVLYSSASPLAVLAVAATGIDITIPPGVPTGPLLGMQCACLAVTLRPRPCAWLSADALVQIVP